MKINLKLDTSKNKKEGFPLVLSIYVSKTDRLYRFSGFFSTLENWDFKKEEPKKSHPLYIGIMSYILETKQKINDLLNQRQKMTAQQIFEHLNGKDDDFYSFWKSRVEELKSTGQDGNALFYEVNLKILKSYKKDLKFSEIDYNFLTKFKLDKKKTCNNGGINTYLKAMRAIYNEGVKRGIYTPNTHISPFTNIMEKATITKDKNLTLDEVRLIVKQEQKHRFYDYFMLMFLLGGVDFVDTSLSFPSIRFSLFRFISSFFLPSIVVRIISGNALFAA
jgi:hypothetical protein